MVIQGSHGVGRQVDCPNPGIGLGRSERQRAVTQLNLSLLHPHKRPKRVDMPPTYAEDLATPQPSPGGQSDGNTAPVRHRLRERSDLGQGKHGPLHRTVGASLDDPARGAHELFIAYG